LAKPLWEPVRSASDRFLKRMSRKNAEGLSQKLALVLAHLADQCVSKISIGGLRADLSYDVVRSAPVSPVVLARVRRFRCPRSQQGPRRSANGRELQVERQVGGGA
jgi:hypothetical protein